MILFSLYKARPAIVQQYNSVIFTFNIYTTETEMQISQPDEEYIEKTSKSLKLFRMN